MATVALKDEFEGSRTMIRRIEVTGADSVAGSIIVEAAELANPNNGRAFGYWKLMEAAWSINDGYDQAKLYYTDETNDYTILLMHPGDGSADFRGWGGATASEVADEGNTVVDEDYEIELDVTENGDENAAGSAYIQLVFKKKDIPFTKAIA